MRAVLFTLSSLLLTAGTAHAQLGLRAGLNLATLSTKSVRNGQNAHANARLGYQIGVFYGQKLSEHLAVVPELQFSRQSTDLAVRDYSIVDGSYTADYRVQLSYLHLPVLLRGHFGRFYVEAGPQASALLAAQETGTQYSTGRLGFSQQEDFDRSATQQYRRFDMSLAAGLGVQLPAGLALGVRASTGLLSLNSKRRSGLSYDGELRSQALQASISYQLTPRS